MITDLEARALRIISAATDRVTVSGEVAWTIRDLLSGPYLTISLTREGFAALRAYDNRNSDPAMRGRIADGMSAAGRSALAQQPKGHGGGDG